MKNVAKKQIRKNLKQQQGFGIVSVMLAIIASLIVIVGVYKLGSYVSTKHKESTAIEQIKSISDNINELYAQSHDFSSLTTQVAIDGGAVDKSDIVGSNIVSPWYSNDSSSIITVAPASNPGAFTVEMDSVPKESCTTVASEFLDKNVSVDGTAVTDVASTTVACAGKDKADISVAF